MNERNASRGREMSEHHNSRTGKLKARFDLLATILLVVVTLMVGGFVLVDRVRPAPSRRPPRGLGVKSVSPPVRVPLADAPVKGSSGARVALVLFSEFECPVCARAAFELMPRFVARYVDTGKVLLVWRHYPLPIHSSARRAAEAAECASRQGRFWELHDWAFAHQNELGGDGLMDAAESLGLDMAVFDRCIGGEADERIETDIALARQLDVEGTPTWFFGALEENYTVKLTSRISGVGPVEVYEQALDSVLQSR